MLALSQAVCTQAKKTYTLKQLSISAWRVIIWQSVKILIKSLCKSTVTCAYPLNSDKVTASLCTQANRYTSVHTCTCICSTIYVWLKRNTVCKQIRAHLLYSMNGCNLTQTVQSTVKQSHSSSPHPSTITCLFQTTYKQHTPPHSGHWHRPKLNPPLALCFTLPCSPSFHKPLFVPVFLSLSLSLPLCSSDFIPRPDPAIINSLYAVVADWSDGLIPQSFLPDGGCYSK